MWTETRLDEAWELASGDDAEHRFVTRFDAPPLAAGEHAVLCFDGIATVADVFLNGERILASESMFVAHELDVTERLRASNELAIVCHPLAPLLAERRQPRARWRSRIADGNLRFFRTSIFGRAPGFAPGPPVVGPWRPVRLRWGAGLDLRLLALRSRVDGEDGVVSFWAPQELELAVGGVTTRARRGELRVSGVERWWPHTHGDPALYDVTADGEPVARVGFRTLETTRDVEAEGLGLAVNGVPVFVRGALWTPHPGEEPRATLELARDAGMNMLRIPAVGLYEDDAFHDLCDELGILVWQDFLFANFDYPIADSGFRALVGSEVGQLLQRLAHRPSLAVLCGNSEVEQQVAMLGFDPALGRGELFGDLLPALVRESGADAVYVPSAPFGGELPMRPDRGVANWFGVGGYRRPLADARLADVRFASECLAFSNLPEYELAEPREGVPRDVGSEWDFADVRDHYLRLLFGDDVPPERYETLSRLVPGELMAEVFGEWRRMGSANQGALVLWLRDVVRGAGWGVIDDAGTPKAALGYLRRALAPVAVWMTDEGLGGIDVHVANDTAHPLRARLRVALYRELELPVDGGESTIEVPPRTVARFGVEGVLGRFVDVSYAYRFGPPSHDAIVVSLDDGRAGTRAVRFPLGRPAARTEIGLTARRDGDSVVIASRKLAYGVRIAGADAADDAFFVEPGRDYAVALRGGGPLVVTAANAIESVTLRDQPAS